MALLVPILLAVVGVVVATQHDRLRWRRAGAIIGFAVVLGAAAQLTADVRGGGGSTRIDRPIADWVLDHRLTWLNPVVRSLTDFGGVAAMTALTLAACAWFGWRRQWARLLTTAAVGAGAAVIGSIMKSAIGRHRPPAIDQLVVATNASYPSGHTLGSTAVAGVVAAMIACSAGQRRSRVLAVPAAALFALVIGVSRIYLGVHWTTDVLAGWAIGLTWLTLCLTPYLWWRSRLSSSRPARPARSTAEPPRRR